MKTCDDERENDEVMEQVRRGGERGRGGGEEGEGGGGVEGVEGRGIREEW